MPALIALAQQELRPVADALVSSPAARRWWEPVDAWISVSWNGMAGRGWTPPDAGWVR